MIVIDTSVWIDYLHDADRPHVAELQRLIDDDRGIALTDVVLTEILQGLAADDDVESVQARLAPLDVLRLASFDDFRRAARLYRDARAQGTTIRRTLDCLIASVCIRDDVPLLHADRDFDRLAACSPLRIWQPAPAGDAESSARRRERDS